MTNAEKWSDLSRKDEGEKNQQIVVNEGGIGGGGNFKLNKGWRMNKSGCANDVQDSSSLSSPATISAEQETFMKKIATEQQLIIKDHRIMLTPP